MNKKFSTLMAGLMLASAFSVASAQTSSAKYENGKYYMLGDVNGNVIVVNSQAGTNYGQLTLVDYDATTDGVKGDLAATRNALWKVTVTQGNVGDAPKFTFQNVATGLYLNISSASVDAETGDVLSNPVIAGAYQEWYNGVSTVFAGTDAAALAYEGAPLMSYVSENKVLYFAAASNTLQVKLGTPADAKDEAKALYIKPYKADIIKNLTAEELNTELLAKATADVFNLTFNKDVTEGAENLFSKTALEAVNATDGYVRLHVKDTKNYIVVDTVLHTGSEAERQLPKFTYDDPAKEAVDGNNVPRLPESFEFAFAYEPNANRILIKSHAYYERVASNAKPVKVTGEDGNTAYTYWPGNNTTTTGVGQQVLEGTKTTNIIQH